MKKVYAEINKVIAMMMEKEAAAEAEYEAAYTEYEKVNDEVREWERRYDIEGEVVGYELDAAYDGEYEVWEKQNEAGDKLDTIRDILNQLREAADAIEDFERV